MGNGSYEIYQNIRTCGGISFEYVDLIETDFAAASGSAYTPPERGDFRRINLARAIQLLSECPVVVETYQTTDAEIRLPAMTVTESTNDAGDGRFFIVKNSGTVNTRITIKDYLGTILWVIKARDSVWIAGNANNTWDFTTNYKEETKEPTGFPDRTSTTISFDNANRRFTIAPTGAFFYYFIRGEQYVKTATETVDITDTDGLWYIFYNGSTLTASQTPWDFEDYIAFVSYVYWDATNNLGIIFGEERHGITMDWSTHKYLHNTIRTTVEKNSFAAGNYTLVGTGGANADAQISFTNGTIHDEDIVISVTNSATPTLPFEQTLSTIAKIPLYYRAGTTAAPLWRKVTATNYPVYGNSPSAAYYNLLTGGNWTLATATNDYYIVTWILATNNIYEPIIGIIGDNQQGTLIDAQKNNVLSQIDIPSLPFVKECKFLYRLIFQTSSAYTNAPKAALRAIASDVSDTVVAGEGVTPPFVFSKDGGCSVGTYLRTGSVQTSRTGQIIKGTNYAVEIHMANLSAIGSTTRIQFQRRTAVSTRSDISGLYIDLPAGQYRSIRTGLQILVGPDWELCCYNKSGSALDDPVVIIYFLPA